MNITDSVREYYGKILNQSSDLKTDACCTTDVPPVWLRNMLANIHEEVLNKYYGCGLVAPELLAGKTILDIGSGSGRDVYVLSQMVGEQGRVIGLDMTPEQLTVARRHIQYHTDKFGYSAPNVQFVEGFMEDLSFIPDQTIDIVVSNCVINLSPQKDQVLKEIYRVLKPGGEFYFSDVYADRRVPAPLRDNELLWGECLSGALYWHDFLDLAKAAGFKDPRLVTDRPLQISNQALQDLLSPVSFWSATYRLWKLDGLESICEDYGQVVRYKGGISGSEGVFQLDGHHRFEKGQSVKVCGNTWNMLKETRFEPFFDFWGDFTVHFGAFPDCGNAVPFSKSAGESQVSGGSCC